MIMKMKEITLGIALMLCASVSAFAQAVSGSAPAKGFDEAGTLTSALKPIAGRNYTYSLDVTNYAKGSTIHWIATQNVNLLEAFGGTGIIAKDNSGLIVNASTTYNDANTATADNNSVTIKWNSKIMTAITAATAPLLVAAKVKDCSDNLKVYNIQPINGFMVDIKNVNNDDFASLAYGANDN